MRTTTKAAVAVTLSAGLVVGAPALAASAHHATLTKSVECGTEYGTYDILVHLANSEADKVMTVTATDLGFIGIGDTVGEGATRDYATTVSGQWVGSGSVSVSWPNGVTHTATASISADEYPTDCAPPPPVIPEQPAPIVEVTKTSRTDCDAKTVTTVTTTTTTGTVYDAASNTWVATSPVVVVTSETRNAKPSELGTQYCPPPMPDAVVETTEQVGEYTCGDTTVDVTITTVTTPWRLIAEPLYHWVLDGENEATVVTHRTDTLTPEQIAALNCLVIVPPTTPPGELVVTGEDIGDYAPLGGLSLALLFGGVGFIMWRMRHRFV